MKRIALMAASVCLAVVSSCAAGKPRGAEASLTVMNWNLQTFFDATFDGNEYSAFRNEKAGWTRAKYEARLDRLAEVIRTLDADVLVFEELEKEAQLYDIANRLSGTFNVAKRYGYACFAGDDGSSIGCAVLSRLPIGEVSVHALDIRTAGKQPRMRPLLQVSVFCGSRKLVVFVNHWKSKSGDTDGTSAAWRRQQEDVLARRMGGTLSAQGGAVLACGDFNMNISEFADYTGGALSYPTNVLLRGGRGLPVYSPWYDEQGDLREPGSYYFHDEWERIDHFFLAGDAELSAFAARTDGAWATEAGVPVGYQVFSGKGYSDHLPLTCSIRF